MTLLDIAGWGLVASLAFFDLVLVLAIVCKILGPNYVPPWRITTKPSRTRLR